MNSRTSMVVLALAVLAGDQQLRSQSTNYNGFDLVDKAGNIRKPSDYRDRFQVLGTYDVRDPKGCMSLTPRLVPRNITERRESLPMELSW